MAAARIAAIEKTDYQQIDDTGASILGFNSAYTIVTCNPYFTQLHTMTSKIRFAAVMALAGGDKPALFKLNMHAIMTAFLSLKSLKIQLIMEKH